MDWTKDEAQERIKSIIADMEWIAKKEFTFEDSSVRNSFNDIAAAVADLAEIVKQKVL